MTLIMANKVEQQEPNVETPEETRQFKLVLLGESSVGKTSLALRFVKKLFYDYQDSTIGSAFFTQTLYLDDTAIKFEIWDTAGQERYYSLSPMYYRSAQAAIVVYDITDEATFERAKIWVREIRKYATNDIVIALVGNKLDLCALRRVEINESQKYAQENDLILMETSAKTNTNITEIFKAIADKLPKNLTPNTVKPFLIRNTDKLTRTFSCCM